MTDELRMPCEEIWEKLIQYGGYNSEVDRDIISVMECVGKKMFYTDIAQYLQMASSQVELIQYILCSMDYAEYGTSPRGCWLTEEGEKMLKIFQERISTL